MLKSQKRKSTNIESLDRRLANLKSGRDEMNLCELPFATLSERNTGRQVLRFNVEEFDHRLGRVVERTLTVKGDFEFGLPTEKDEEIYLGLLKYSSDYNGFADPEVRFSRSALFELMGWPKSDWAYARLTKGMHRLVGVRLSYQNLWRDNRDKQWRDQGAFGILDSFEFRDSRSSGSAASFTEQSSLFRWGAVLFQSFDSGYLKTLDYGLTRDLSVTARRLYRYLDKHFYPPKKTQITIDLARLAYQHISVSHSVEMDKVRKRRVGPAADELVEVGYLKPPSREWFSKVRRGVWNATFDLAEACAKQDAKVVDRSARELADALARRGLSSADALHLIATHKPPELAQAMRALDEQVHKGVAIRNARRWFNRALAEGYRASVATERSAMRPELKLFRRSRKAG